MVSPPAWRETESKVHEPALWLPLVVGSSFVLSGFLFLFLCLRENDREKVPWWFMGPFLGIFVVAGGGVLIWFLRRVLSPQTIRHATGILSNVPTEPVILEGSIVHGRLTHELVETSSGWEYRSDERVPRANRRFLIGFGVPFLLLGSGVMTYVFHDRGLDSWVVAALAALLVVGVCGGGALAIMGFLMQATQRSLCRFVIPGAEGDLEFESTDGLKLEAFDWAKILKWIFKGGGKRCLVIPRLQIVAVQLCPWSFVMGSSNNTSGTWAVQGLLVLAESGARGYRRLPILLTDACEPAARLMRRLSEVLGVPFLFHADAAGWKAEKQRAKARPPLRSGGAVT